MATPASRAEGLLEIAVVGGGLMGRRHAELIAAEAGCRIAAVVDPSAEAAAGAATRGLPYAARLEEVLRDGPPAGAVIATPNELHVAQARKCLDAGVAVLIEKPVAPKVAAARELAAAVARSRVPALVGHHRHYNPLVEQAAALVASGTLGRLVAVQGAALFCKPEGYFDAAPWRREPGGGPVLINLVHEVGVLRALVGEIIQVQALASHAHRGFAVEDSIALTMRFAGGAVGTFVLSDTAAAPFSWEQTSGESASYPAYPECDCYVLAGTHGALAVPTLRLWRYDERTERSWWTPFETARHTPERGDPLVRQLRHFLDVIAGNASPRVTVADGLRNLEVCEAVLEAARTGATITLA